jgi:hypothetical protein
VEADPVAQLQELEQVVPYAMKDFHTDHGGEFLVPRCFQWVTAKEVRTPTSKHVPR